MDRRKFLISGTATVGSGILLNGCLKKIEETPKNNSTQKNNGYNYSLPNLIDGTRLVFQGDSITDMNWGRDERDRNHYLGHSYVFLIASRLGVDMPNVNLDFYNRGISGNKVSDLKERWQKDTIDMRPDLLSILVGINDILNGITPTDYESDYKYILDKSLKANPDLKLVLMDPFVLNCGWIKSNNEWKERREMVDKFGAIVDQLAKNYNAVHIKMQQVFDEAVKSTAPEHWIWDGIHPLPQGHELIARNWLKETSNRW